MCHRQFHIWRKEYFCELWSNTTNPFSPSVATGPKFLGYYVSALYIVVRDELHTQPPSTLADNTVALAATSGLLPAAIRHFRPGSHNLTRCIGRLLVSAVLLSDLIPQFQDVKVSLVTSTLFLRGSLQGSQKRLFFYGDDAWGTGGNPLPFLLYNKVGRTTIVRRKFVWLLPFGRRC